MMTFLSVMAIVMGYFVMSGVVSQLFVIRMKRRWPHNSSDGEHIAVGFLWPICLPWLAAVWLMEDHTERRAERQKQEALREKEADKILREHNINL